MVFKKGNIPWNKGKQGLQRHSEETRRKLSKALIRNQNARGNKGKPCSEERKRNISKALRGRSLSEEHKRNLSESMKGTIHSPESRANNARARKGIKLSEEHKRNISKSFLGSKNPSWRGGISFEYGENWPVQRLRALRRDRHTCQKCGKTIEEIQIHVHHIIPFRYFKDYEEANKLENLICLCNVHHTEADAKFRSEEVMEILI